MYKKTLHTVFSLFLVVLFQLPTWIQFEHSFHKHDSIHICDAKGSDRHIHNAVADSCKELHKIVNPNLHLVTFNYQKTATLSLYEQLCIKTTNTSKQIILYSDLRAPPIHIL